MAGPRRTYTDFRLTRPCLFTTGSTCAAGETRRKRGLERQPAAPCRQLDLRFEATEIFGVQTLQVVSERFVGAFGVAQQGIADMRRLYIEDVRTGI